MTQLQILTKFTSLFNDVKQSLENYNEHLRNELFGREPDETNEEAYQRGETIFDRCEDDLRNLKDVLERENEIILFFEKCKENQQKLFSKKNEIKIILLSTK